MGFSRPPTAPSSFERAEKTRSPSRSLDWAECGPFEVGQALTCRFFFPGVLCTERREREGCKTRPAVDAHIPAFLSLLTGDFCDDGGFQAVVFFLQLVGTRLWGLAISHLLQRRVDLLADVAFVLGVIPSFLSTGCCALGIP